MLNFPHQGNFPHISTKVIQVLDPALSSHLYAALEIKWMISTIKWVSFWFMFRSTNLIQDLLTKKKKRKQKFALVHKEDFCCIKTTQKVMFKILWKTGSIYKNPSLHVSWPRNFTPSCVPTEVYTHVYQKTSSRMFTATLLIISLIWKWPKCPSTIEWKNK